MKKEQLQELLSKMTLGEKFGQLSQSTGEHFIGKIDDEMVETGPTLSELDVSEEQMYTLGSVLGSSGAKVTNAIQKAYLEKSRLKIPLLFMHDAIHGYKTIFPIPLALSCSWDKEIVKKVGEYTASELRASGIHVNFSPMTDLVRDARWGRVMESFGEDHILSGDLGKAMIGGYQKDWDGKISNDGVVSCLKHFAAYGAVEAGVDYGAVDMSLKEFFTYYGRPYEIALESKPRMVMSSFNSLNGEPVTASKWLLTDVLRKQYGFEGMVISDWGAVSELVGYGIVSDAKEAAYAAINAGVDIEMVTTSYMRFGEDIVNEEPKLLQKINDAVMLTLQIKNELGLFENPYVDEIKEEENILTEEALEFSKESAKASCVLLKNNGILPLSKNIKKILIVGPYAKTNELLGNWPCKGSFSNTVTLVDGIRKVIPSAEILAFEELSECPKEFLNACESIIVTIGESWELSGEGHSSTNIELMPKQRDLVKKVKALSKPYVCLGFAGRPLALQNIIEDIPSLLWCWYLGTKAGEAIAELLFGEGSPCGKLTMSFPRVNAQVPIRYNEYRTGKPANETSYSSRYQDCEIGPLFAFGHGMSYAKIEYKNFWISDNVIYGQNNNNQEGIEISFDFINKSDFECSEIVILYIEDKISKNVRPVREMKKYEKIKLAGNEETKVRFKLTADDLKYLDTSLKMSIEPGDINIYINNLDVPVFQVKYAD